MRPSQSPPRIQRDPPATWTGAESRAACTLICTRLEAQPTEIVSFLNRFSLCEAGTLATRTVVGGLTAGGGLVSPRGWAASRPACDVSAYSLGRNPSPLTVSAFTQGHVSGQRHGGDRDAVAVLGSDIVARAARAMPAVPVKDLAHPLHRDTWLVRLDRHEGCALAQVLLVIFCVFGADAMIGEQARDATSGKADACPNCGRFRDC